MEIDIYTRWKHQTDAEHLAQARARPSIKAGHLGYLHETDHGEPYGTCHLVAEAFASCAGATISAAVLRERLPLALEIVEENEYLLYDSSDEEIEDVKQSFRSFVDLCELKEKQTGEIVRIVASY